MIKRILSADPGFTIVIEGHCDERGSEEYNLALGDRRALAVKEFLVQLGVPEDRFDDLVTRALEDPTAGGNPIAMTRTNTAAMLEAAFRGTW